MKCWVRGLIAHLSLRFLVSVLFLFFLLFYVFAFCLVRSWYWCWSWCKCWFSTCFWSQSWSCSFCWSRYSLCFLVLVIALPFPCSLPYTTTSWLSFNHHTLTPYTTTLRLPTICHRRPTFTRTIKYSVLAGLFWFYRLYWSCSWSWSYCSS